MIFDFPKEDLPWQTTTHPHRPTHFRERRSTPTPSMPWAARPILAGRFDAAAVEFAVVGGQGVGAAGAYQAGKWFAENGLKLAGSNPWGLTIDRSLVDVQSVAFQALTTATSRIKHVHTTAIA